MCQHLRIILKTNISAHSSYTTYLGFLICVEKDIIYVEKYKIGCAFSQSTNVSFFFSWRVGNRLSFNALLISLNVGSHSKILFSLWVKDQVNSIVISQFRF